MAADFKVHSFCHSVKDEWRISHISFHFWCCADVDSLEPGRFYHLKQPDLSSRCHQDIDENHLKKIKMNHTMFNYPSPLQFPSQHWKMCASNTLAGPPSFAISFGKILSLCSLVYFANAHSFSKWWTFVPLLFASRKSWILTQTPWRAYSISSAQPTKLFLLGSKWWTAYLLALRDTRQSLI